MVGLVAKPRLVIWEMRKSMYYSVCKHGPNALVKAVQGVLLCAQRGGGGGANTAVGLQAAVSCDNRGGSAHIWAGADD